MDTDYWMADAEYLSVGQDGTRWLIGEDENAEWWITRGGEEWFRFDRWNPLHWLRFWNSRRRRAVVFLFG